ncbi:unnamed protein product [Caenorhabditis nigoni]
MPRDIPATKGVYLLERVTNKEINLENIDEEMRMEQVRQAGAKLDWASFGQAVRRNLQEKRNTIDADGRIDVLKSLAFMKTKLPIEPEAPMEEKIRIMAESLGCTHVRTTRGWTITKPEELNMDLTIKNGEVDTVVLSFWEEPAFYSGDATKMLHKGEWSELRDRLANMLSVYNKDLNRNDRKTCKAAMDVLASMLKTMNADEMYTSIHNNNYGYYLSRSDLRQGRLYYNVEPLYRRVRAKHHTYSLQKEDWDILPYFEFSFVPSDSVQAFPEHNPYGEWKETGSAKAAVCLKLSKGVLVSEPTRRKLHEISARSTTIQCYTNCYRYLTGSVLIKDNLKMITQFPGECAQHHYTVDRSSFTSEGDSVITEIYLKRLQDFHKVIEILRKEAMHISIWESVLADCYELQGLEERMVPAINMYVNLSRDVITIRFRTKYAPIRVCIRDGVWIEAKVEVVNDQTGAKIADRVDELLTRKLNETWSIPIMLTFAVSGEDCALEKMKVPLREENPETKLPTPTKIIVHKN